MGVPPEGSLTSTYSPWRGDFSRAAFACCSDGGRFASRAGAAGAGGVDVRSVAARRRVHMSASLISRVFQWFIGGPPARPGHGHDQRQPEQSRDRAGHVEERIAGNVVGGWKVKAVPVVHHERLDEPEEPTVQTGDQQPAALREDEGEGDLPAKDGGESGGDKGKVADLPDRQDRRQGQDQAGEDGDRQSRRSRQAAAPPRVDRAPQRAFPSPDAQDEAEGERPQGGDGQLPRRCLLGRGRERRPVGQIAEGEEALVRHEGSDTPSKEQQPAAGRAARLVIGGALQTGKENDREDEGDNGIAPEDHGPVVLDLTEAARGGRQCEEQPQGDQQNSEDGGPDQTKSPPRSGHTLPRRPSPPAAALPVIIRSRNTPTGHRWCSEKDGGSRKDTSNGPRAHGRTHRKAGRRRPSQASTRAKRARSRGRGLTGRRAFSWKSPFGQKDHHNYLTAAR